MYLTVTLTLTLIVGLNQDGTRIRGRGEVMEEVEATEEVEAKGPQGRDGCLESTTQKQWKS